MTPRRSIASSLNPSTSSADRESYSREADQIDDAADNEPIRSLHGMRTVREALRLEDFPMTRSEIDYAVGDIEVENGFERPIPVRLLTDHFQVDIFDSTERVIEALRAALHDLRSRSGAV